jgi:hypothetical protein
MDITKLHSSWNDKVPYRITKALTFTDLVTAIEYLDENNIISIESFKELSSKEIKDTYFGMAHPTSIKKATIKITDKKEGKTEQSSLTTIIETYSKNGIQIKKTIDFF